MSDNTKSMPPQGYFLIGGKKFVSADASMTSSEAMERCEAVAALVKASQLAEKQLEAFGGDGLASGITSALAPFTKGATDDKRET